MQEFSSSGRHPEPDSGSLYNKTIELSVSSPPPFNMALAGNATVTLSIDSFIAYGEGITVPLLAQVSPLITSPPLNTLFPRAPYGSEGIFHSCLVCGPPFLTPRTNTKGRYQPQRSLKSSALSNPSVLPGETGPTFISDSGLFGLQASSYDVRTSDFFPYRFPFVYSNVQPCKSHRCRLPFIFRFAPPSMIFFLIPGKLF